jgi:radical SAM superfamily enzyme YgiQ (UPF0313 family)
VLRRAKTCLVLCPGWDPTSPPLGPALLKSFLLSRGYEAATVDLGPLFIKAAPPEVGDFIRKGDMTFLQSKRLVSALLLRMSETVEEAVRRILACEPDVVGFTVYFSTWHMSVLLAKRLKELAPRISIVLGGPEGMRYFNLGGNPMEGQDELDAVDAIIPGEGELPLLALLSGWNQREGGFKPCAGAHVKVDGRFVWTEELPPIQDLDSLPFPDFDGFDVGDYDHNNQLITYFSRGCFKKCVFCDVENYWKSWRNRSGPRVVEEIEHLAGKHPEDTNFFFGDSLLNADMKGLLQFCRLMREKTAAGRLRPISWRGYAVVRPDMTADSCKEMKAAGCSELWFGIESGSQRILDSMKKGCRVAAADAVLRNCREAGIRTQVLLLVGFPTETPAEFEETLAFVRRNASNISRIVVAGHAYIDNETALHKEAFSRYGVSNKLFHPLFWTSNDGNTFPERLRRLDDLSRCAQEAGIPMDSPNRERSLAAYDEWRTVNA